MSHTFTYKNERGTVTMHGDGSGLFKVIAIDGLGPVEKEYSAAVYTGYRGQETVSSRELPRTLTFSVEVSGKNIKEDIVLALDVLNSPGMLTFSREERQLRIYCNQVQVYDVRRTIKGQILSFLIQMVCDNPYFEDKDSTIIPLYKRTKLLKTPFSLPAAFGKIIYDNVAKVNGSIDVEPTITLYYPEATEEAEFIEITNATTGKKITLNYAPKDSDTVVIDVKNRKITSSASGNLINYLSDDSFLGDFILKRGINNLSVNLGDMTEGFTCECQYRNFYHEAVII